MRRTEKRKELLQLQDIKNESEGSEGLRKLGYLLRTNIPDWTPQEVWSTYIQLVHVEEAFRIEKDQLEIRPVYHQKQDRVRAHIFVCFLAYCLWKILEQWQIKAGLGNSPRTLLDELAQIQSADVKLPTETGTLIRLRCIIKPEKHQQILLQHMGLTLPQRMAMTPGVLTLTAKRSF